MSIQLKRLARARFASVLATMTLGATGAGAQAAVLFQESFANGLGQFTSAGWTTVSTAGARMAGCFYGCTDGSIQSRAISTTGYNNLSLTFTRATAGLDTGEAGIAEFSTNGSTYTAIESQRTVNGATTVALPAAAAGQSTLYLRFRINANGTTETYTVSNIRLDGTADGGTPPPPPPPPPGEEFPPTTGTPSCTNLLPGKFNCTLSGRTYNVVVPNAYGQGTRAVPLVVDIHGYTENADKEQTRTKWDTLAATENFIVAYPNGKNNSWNAQGECCGNPGTTTEQDVQFIRDVVAAVKQAGRIKAERVYVTGYSNGGSMSHTIACMAADVFNGAGPVAYPLSGGSYAQVVAACKPSRPIPVLTFQGDNDTLVPYNGGSKGILTAQDSRTAWAEIQRCSTTFTTTNPLSNVKCEIHSGCNGGVKTGLCTVARGTHDGIYEVGSPGVAGLIWNFWKSGW